MKGDVPSSHHDAYFSSSRKVKQKLKFGEKCGPIREWPPSQVAIHDAQLVTSNYVSCNCRLLLW